MFECSGEGVEAAVSEIVALEVELRRLQARQVELLAELDASQVYRVDAHTSAKVMMRHHGRLSAAEASRRERSMRALRDLPGLGAAWAAGVVGTEQVRRIATLWANVRVRDQLVACEDVFVDAAVEMEWPDFELFCRDFEAAVDADGAHDKARRRWQRRSVAVAQDLDGFYDARMNLTSLDGAELVEILDRLVEAERLADIEAARAEHGDQWRLHLPRTTAQLRYDAFMHLIRRGAGAGPGTKPAETTVNVMIDQATLEHHLTRLLGAEPEPIDPLDPHRMTRTADGRWVNPVEIAARTLTDHVRRVVHDAAGVVIDLGTRQRLFAGSARDAAVLGQIRCYWPGCWIPASRCQVDHLHPFREGGPTNPGNGAPACGHHNRTKEQGYTAWRDPTGTWHLARPDGTSVPRPTTARPEAA